MNFRFVKLSLGATAKSLTARGAKKKKQGTQGSFLSPKLRIHPYLSHRTHRLTQKQRA